MSDETNEERQDNELAALQSIYGDAVKDNRENIAWKVWRPLDILLTLNPLHNSDIQGVHCSITLHFKCCPGYPDKAPTMAIHKMHGLSTDNGTKLLAELESLASQLCGEVMIFQLAQHAQQFLHDHNKPTLSCYEEMLKEKNETEKMKQHVQQAKEEEERQKIKDEIQRRQNILKGAGRQRSHMSSISQEVDSTDGQADTPELVCYADDKMFPMKKAVRSRTAEVACTCNAKGVVVLRVTQKNNKKVYIGNCLGHSSMGAITYLAIDEETGEQLITKKWSISPSGDFQMRNRQQESLQNDFRAASRITHPSLVPYVAMETCKEVVKYKQNQFIYIFRSFILGTSLRNLRKKFNGFGDKYEALKLLRNVANGVLSALFELHSVGVLHRDVRAENVYLDDYGRVKLVGVALDSRLAEMMDCDSYCDRQTAAQDIYASGQLFLSIVSQDRTYTDLPQELPDIAKDFISRCLTEDEQSQWSAKQLMNHIFLVDAPARQPTKKEKDDSGSGSEDEDDVKKIQKHVSLATSGHSRLNAEFEVLAWLGKGAFGDVLKVKNKLDGGFYAIKRVDLNPESVQLNKKITREVKLLSRLNHENVVRYYNAWIESTTVAEESEDSSVSSRSPIKKPGDSLACVVAKLGQEVKVEWSMSEGPVQKTNSSSDSEEEDDDDEPDPWFNIMSPEDESSECIQFEKNSNESHTLPSDDVVDAPVNPQSEGLKQVLYIQMEFCEKHTLRHAIDNGLYQEHFRAWRLFREIVGGLAHVHQRGMIHRDLKPMNIFLDSHDHVKIGDFGLATKAFSGLLLEDKVKQPEEIGGSLTGQVGTALYVAPELLQSTSKLIYNQKVDIYSLGIILFEMFHPPLETGMERMMILTDLRTKDIIVPRNFDVEENAKQIHVIRWLLNHEASLRPTCAELLSSEHVPRPVPEGALSGLLSHALSDRGARGYQRLVAACLDQRVSAAEDYTYHNGMKSRPGDTIAAVKDAVIKIFRSHGASEFSPPFLTPRATAWDQYPNAVKVMTAAGYVCHLPHDLRLPFARHTAYSDVKNMRRYVVDRVYREKHVPGFHPREMIECAFDIVTPKTVSLWPDAELLVVASRAAAECNLKVSIQLNHTELIRILLQSCGVPLDKHADIYPVLADVSFGRIRGLQLQTHLASLCLSGREVSLLVRLLETDAAVLEAREALAPALRPRAAAPANRALHDLETVYHNARALGCDCPMTVAPFLAYNATQHSGVFWQMFVTRQTDYKPNAKHRAGDLIAAGGRYDALVEEFWKVARTERDHNNSDIKTSSVGFSMSLERMAAILKKMEVELPAVDKPIEVCVWGAAGAAGAGREGQAAARRAGLARRAWGAGLRAAVVPQPEPPRDLAPQRTVLRLLDHHTVVVSAWDADRMREHKVPYTEVIDFMKQKMNPEAPRSSEVQTTNKSVSWSDSEKSSGLILSVTFITANDRMTKNSKRQCESQISSQVCGTGRALGASGRARCCALALSCEAACVRALAAHLAAPLHAHDLPATFRAVANMFPKRQNILEEACIELTNAVKQSYQNRTNDEIQLFALYSIPDSLCRLIT